MYADMICNNNYQVCTLFVLGVLVHLQAGWAHYAASYASDEAYFEAHYAASYASDEAYFDAHYAASYASDEVYFEAYFA